MRQLIWSIIFRLHKFILVDRISWHVLHKKYLTNYAIFGFYIAFQNTTFTWGVEDSARSFLSLSSFKAYADFTEKVLLLVGHQIIFSIAPNKFNGILQMVLVSSLVKIWVINYLFQVFVTWSMRLATDALLSRILIGDWTRWVVGTSNQVSLQTCTLCPSPISQSKPALMREIESWKLR